MVDQIVLLLCFISFGAAAYTDIRSRTIPNWPHFLLLATGVLRMLATGCYASSLLGFLGLGGCFLLLGAHLGGLGGGDVKLIATSCLVFGFPLGLWGLLFSLLFSLSYGLIKKVSHVCYAPFHGVGFILALTLNGGL